MGDVTPANQIIRPPANVGEQARTDTRERPKPVAQPRDSVDQVLDVVLPWRWSVFNDNPAPAPTQTQHRAEVRPNPAGVTLTEPDIFVPPSRARQVQAQAPLRIESVDNPQANDNRVRRIQENLDRLGFFDQSYGPGERTPGRLDRRTLDAINDFARAYTGRDGGKVPEMSPTGELPDATERGLRAAVRTPSLVLGGDRNYSQVGRPTLRESPGGVDPRTDRDASHRFLAKRMLSALGYEVTPGAGFDRETMQQLDRFQTLYEARTGESLGSRGALGPRMGDALRAAVEASRPLERNWREHTEGQLEEERRNNPLAGRNITVENARPTDAPIVQEVQRALVDFGYRFTNGKNMTEVTPSGRMDAQTQAALADFQRMYSWMVGDLAATGQINGTTLNILRNREVTDGMRSRIPTIDGGDTGRGIVINGYHQGQAYPMVVRYMGHTPDGDNPSYVDPESGRTGRPRYLETRAAFAYLAALKDHPDMPQPGSGYRFYDEQAGLRRAKGRMAAPAGYSEHQDGQALDVPRYNGVWHRNSRDYGFYQHGAAGEEHHYTLRTRDATRATRAALGLRAISRETIEPVRVVQNRPHARHAHSAPRHVHQTRGYTHSRRRR